MGRRRAHNCGYYDRFIDQTSTAYLATAPAGKPVFMWVTPHAPHKSAASTQDWEPDIEPRYASDPRCDGINPWRPPNYLFAGQPNGYPLDDICRSMLTVDDIVGDLERVAARGWSQSNLGPHVRQWHGLGLARLSAQERSAADRLPFFITARASSRTYGRSRFEHRLWPNPRRSRGHNDAQGRRQEFRGGLDGSGGGRQAMLEDHPVGGPTGEGDVATGPWWAVRTPHGTWSCGTACTFTTVDNDPWEMNDVPRNTRTLSSSSSTSVFSPAQQSSRCPRHRPLPARR